VIRRAADKKLFLLSVTDLAISSREEIRRFPDAETAKLEQFRASTIASTKPVPTSRPLLGQDFPDDINVPDDINGALERAKATNRNLMIVFLGDNKRKRRTGST